MNYCQNKRWWMVTNHLECRSVAIGHPTSVQLRLLAIYCQKGGVICCHDGEKAGMSPSGFWLPNVRVIVVALINEQLERWENNQFKRLDDELEDEARWEYERTKREEDGEQEEEEA